MRTELNASKTYGELLRTPQWLERRKQILKRDGYHCRNCGSGYGLEVHHRQYHNLKGKVILKKLPWAYDESNLVTLCSRCHQIGHKKYNVPVFNV